MRLSRNRVTWGGWLLLMVILAGGCSTTKHHLYEGERKSPKDLAAVFDSYSVQIESIDGAPVSQPGAFFQPKGSVKRYRLDTFYLLPGRHTIVARVNGANYKGDYTVQSTAKNAWSFYVDLQAGSFYTFEHVDLSNKTGKTLPVLQRVETTERTGSASVLNNALNHGSASAKERFEPEVVPRPVEPPGPDENAVVIGQGVDLAPRDDGSRATNFGWGSSAPTGGPTFTATGQLITLCEDTPQNRQSLVDVANRESSQRPKGNQLTTGYTQTTRGYGLGFFEFRDVPAGNYLVYWRTFNVDIYVGRVRVEEGDTVVGPVHAVLPAQEIENAPHTRSEQFVRVEAGAKGVR